VTAGLIERGELRKDEASAHPLYGVLTRALGVGPEVEIDHEAVAVDGEARVVVCSDGLFNEVSDEEIASALAGGADATEVVDCLIELAVTHGGRDNVSIVVAELAV
jgi:protein phosphatase